MNAKLLSLIMLLVTGTAVPVCADIINGSFEAANFDGWFATVKANVVKYGDSEENPSQYFYGEFPILVPIGNGGFGVAIIDDAFYSPVDGEKYLQLMGDHNDMGTFEYSGMELHIVHAEKVTVSQEVTLGKGDVLSGWVAFKTYDYPPFNWDRAAVTISSVTGCEQITEITVKDAYGENWDNYGDNNVFDAQSPWTYWSWSAPECGRYILSLINFYDAQAGSFACFDNVQLTHVCIVNEPKTVQLLCFGLVILARYKHRRKNRWV